MCENCKTMKGKLNHNLEQTIASSIDKKAFIIHCRKCDGYYNVIGEPYNGETVYNKLKPNFLFTSVLYRTINAFSSRRVRIVMNFFANEDGKKEMFECGLSNKEYRIIEI